MQLLLLEKEGSGLRRLLREQKFAEIGQVDVIRDVTPFVNVVARCLELSGAFPLALITWHSFSSSFWWILVCTGVLSL